MGYFLENSDIDCGAHAIFPAEVSTGLESAAGNARSPAGTAKNAVGVRVVVPTDGVETRLRGHGALRIFESDVLRMDGKGKALIETDEGIQVALNGKARGVTRVLRVQHRSKACTRPAATDVATVVGWSRPLVA